MAGVKKVPIEQLAADQQNPRTISDDALAGLAASISTFGDLGGIVFNRRTGHLVSGHQRVRALRDAGAKQWLRNGETGWVEHPGTKERFPVRIVDWDEQTERAANLTANNPAITGEFTAAALAQLEELRAGLEGSTDFADLRLDELLEQLRDTMGVQEPLATGATDPNEVPADSQVSLVTKPGDLWVLGEHRLLCGDSTNLAHVSALMGERRAALMATDPPYGDDWVEKARDMAEKGFGHSRAGLHGSVRNDDLSTVDLSVLLEKFLEAAKQAGDPPFPAYVWCGSRRMLFEKAMSDAGYHIHQMVIWLKPSFVIGRLHYHPRCEFAIHGWLRGGGECSFYGPRNQSDVWELDRENEGIHPTQKPVELFLIPIRNHTKPGETCYEPFSGSGTQIVAGEQSGRSVCAMEIEPRYVDVAVARWERFTGRKAVRHEAVISSAPCRPPRTTPSTKRASTSSS